MKSSTSSPLNSPFSSSFPGSRTTNSLDQLSTGQRALSRHSTASSSRILESSTIDNLPKIIKDEPGVPRNVRKSDESSKADVIIVNSDSDEEVQELKFSQIPAELKRKTNRDNPVILKDDDDGSTWKEHPVMASSQLSFPSSRPRISTTDHQSTPKGGDGSVPDHHSDSALKRLQVEQKRQALLGNRDLLSKIHALDHRDLLIGLESHCPPQYPELILPSRIHRQ